MMPLAATLTELEVITLNQVNQKERDKCRITCMQSPKRDQINLFTKQKHTRRHIKQTCGYQKGKGGLWDKLGV